MTTLNVRPATSRRPPMVPHQHGAWAFLALPLVLALPLAGWDRTWPLVAIGWVAAYPASWAVTGLLAGPRPARFRRAAWVWVPPTVLVAALLAWSRPWLLVVGAGYLALFLVHLTYARHRDERALANDLLLVVECALMVPVTVGVVDGDRTWWPPASAWSAASGVLTLSCLLGLAASVLHVKSRIRERRDPRYAVAARGFALTCIPVVAAVAVIGGSGPWLALPFVAMAARTWLPAAWRPARVGLVELGCFVALAVVAWLG